jgi:transcriptional regulator with XRE-family HTH domain
MSSHTAEAITSRSVADWSTVGQRMAAARHEVGLALDDLAGPVGLDAGDLSRQEAGEPVLGSFDLERVAGFLGTTIGAWFYEDQRAMFRGVGDDRAATEAEEIGRRLMAEYLAVEAACS